ncbi:MAG: DEAD/DEAH box helicase [Candidatus Bathyarchaeia archaeon]
MNVFSLLSKPLIRALREEGIEEPTEIQRLAIPKILMGENVLLIAPTGTGKTEGACIPVFELFLRTMPSISLKAPQEGIAILYITPLRALNRDIFRRLFRIGEKIGIRIEVRHGDTDQATRRLQSIKPPDMLITTPETLQAILPGRRMKDYLRNVRWVIVDEVHEICSDKRGAQLSVALERLRWLTGKRFQRIGLSATIGDPELVARFLGGLEEVKVLRVPIPKMMEIWVESPSPTEEDTKAADRLLISPGSVARVRRILELMESHKPMIVFVNTREHAEALASRILSLQQTSKVGVHHGSLSRDVRVKTEQDLREGRLQCVIATSSLELGIDIGTLDFVVHYMSPRQVVRLVHRIGRSGHAVFGKSRGCILSGLPEDILESAIIAKRMLEGRLEKPTIQFNALDVLAHQIAGLLLDRGSLRLSEAFESLRKAYPYQNLELEDFELTIRQMAETRLISLYGDTISPRRRLHEYYFENISMIPEVRQYRVYDFSMGRTIGFLDQEFIGRNGSPGVEFIMHGQTWRILSIEDERRQVNVEPIEGSLGAIPSWEGEIIPVPFEIAEELGRVYGSLESAIRGGKDPIALLDTYPITMDAKKKIVEYVSQQIAKGFEVPTDKRIVVEANGRYIVIHACFGNLINEALGRVLSAILSNRFGSSIGMQVDAYRIALIIDGGIAPKDVIQEIRGLEPGQATSVLKAILPETSLFAWRLWNVAKRFGIVEREADYSLSKARALVAMLQKTAVFEETFRELCVEKLDAHGAEGILSFLKEGKIEVLPSRGSEPASPMALPILDRIAPHDLLRPALPSTELLAYVKERLNRERLKLICLYKNDWESIQQIGKLGKEIRCPSCGSTLIAATSPQDLELRRIIAKKLGGKRLGPEEAKRWMTAWKSAGLLQTYGRLGALLLAGRGIGPTMAIRLLRRYYRSEDELYYQIVKAEREFVRTRQFW